MESAPTDQDGYPQEMEYSTGSDEEEDQGSPYPVKMEITDRPFPPHTPQPVSEESTSAAPPAAAPKTNGSTKQSISSIIDRNPEADTATAMPPPPTSTETPTSASQEQTTPVHEKSEINGSSQPEREASESKEPSETKSEAQQ